jgi:hypothetical protein
LAQVLSFTRRSASILNQSNFSKGICCEVKKMAADGGLAEGGDEFDPRSADLECHERHINSALTAPDQSL